MTSSDGAHDPFTQTAHTSPQMKSAEVDAPAASRAGSKGMGPAMLLRLLVLSLSAGGMVVGLALWLSGHGWLAARLIAGDVLLIVVVLLVLALL